MLSFNQKRFLFWDFDGVIKDSVDVKTCAFVSLFKNFGSEVLNQVVEHHEANGGVSRFEKMPLYLNWAGVKVNKSIIEKYLSSFSNLVVKDVIDSPWVPGVVEYLEKYKSNQMFFLVTATPKWEIELILKQLSLYNCFYEIIGAPTKKIPAIKSIVREFNITTMDAGMIGDSESDMEAAVQNDIDFFLRKTLINKPLQSLYKGPQFENFIK
jgi:phosphoglycolate phosphatase-like HAD superfamily hydrolase